MIEAINSSQRRTNSAKMALHAVFKCRKRGEFSSLDLELMCFDSLGPVDVAMVFESEGVQSGVRHMVRSCRRSCARSGAHKLMRMQLIIYESDPCPRISGLAMMLIRDLKMPYFYAVIGSGWGCAVLTEDRAMPPERRETSCIGNGVAFPPLEQQI